MKKYLITSALPYVNNIPHIGNFVGSVLPADVYARFCRAKYGDDNVLFVCGADAHGSPIVIQAKKEGVSPAELVAKYHALHTKIFNDFNISFDGGYGTTHTELQTKLVHELFDALDKNGFIEEKTTVQPFSIDDNMFLADRQIEGTCPKCGFEKARGDQCDKCGELLDPADLINPYAADSGSHNIEMRDVKNLFYRADKVHDDVKKWFDENHTMWSKSAVAATKKYLTENVPNPSVSRDLPWGIPVNKPGYEDKVFYVWFDAPWGYVSISQGATADWEKWWLSDDCHYAQFMGKDNIKFHSLFFPGQEIAWCDKNWKKVDQLKGMNFLNFQGDKISKSSGNGVFLNDALDDASADCWRYALMASAPETDDTDFTVQRFADIVNKDLNGILGNFVSRVCKITEKNFGAAVPHSGTGDWGLGTVINPKLAELTTALDACEFRKAIDALRGMWAIGNEFFTAKEPWALVKTDLDAAGAVLHECFGMIDFFARVSAPFIPETAEKMRRIFSGLGTGDWGLWPTKYESRITDGTKFSVSDNLFERLDDDKIKSMVEKYTRVAPKIVVAKIMTAEPHPDSDHLQILTVEDGNGPAQTVVCGAPNVRAGMIGVWAKPGAHLPAIDLTMTARKVRGVMSSGMMCAPDELGTGDDHDGIIELPADSVIGTEFKV